MKAFHLTSIDPTRVGRLGTLAQPPLPPATERSQTMSVSTARRSIDDLRGRVTGRVIGPDDEGYDDARAVLYDFVDCHPAAVVRVANAADVAEEHHPRRHANADLPGLGGKAKGDIHYRFVIDVPASLSKEQSEAVDKLSEVMNGNPRARLFAGDA
jgi:hypothetical protein